MAANKFGRYIWLVNLIKNHPCITFRQISEAWADSGLGDGKCLPWRTFMNHKEAIETIFDVIVECDPKAGYGYYIADDELQGNNLRSWLIDSYATLNQVQADSHLQSRISFEQIPSGSRYLQTLLQAMRKNRVVELEYQSFNKPSPYTFELEPYHLKVVRRRWYLIGHSPKYNTIYTYALDRMLSVKVTDKLFDLPADFDIDRYFEGCVGIMANDDAGIERVVIKTYDWARWYIKTLPLHASQREIARDNNSITFELWVRPTFDFMQLLLQQAGQVEILEPEWVKEWMCTLARDIWRRYHPALPIEENVGTDKNNKPDNDRHDDTKQTE